MIIVSWRYIYIVTIALRFYFALSNSYIHPDEHFQSFEVLCGRFFQYTTNEPWEFSSSAPARSFAPLLILYFPVIKLGQYLDLSPLQTWYLARLELMLLSWMVTDWCLYKMLPNKQERIKAIYFSSTSFVSLVYQSHTFSNSFETVLVILAVYMINELRFLRSVPNDQYATREILALSAGIGCCFGLGIFNRVTYPVYFVLPLVFILQATRTWIYMPFVALCCFILVSTICVLTDTVLFSGLTLSDLMTSPANWSQYIVTPLNNIIYNSKIENLAQHGLHPLYTHVLVNLPQIMGPGLFFVIPYFKNRYWRTTPFLSAISALFFLSMVPHQELRFLIPVVPLLCACFDLTALEGLKNPYPFLVPLLMNFWLVFNAVLSVLMGVFHQGGVVPALDHIRESSLLKDPGTTIIWWRTYSPPTWMLGKVPYKTQIISINDEHVYYSLAPETKNYIFDTMGTETQQVRRIISDMNSISSRLYLVAPIASFKQHFNSTQFKSIWTYRYHIDMDHLDFSHISSLEPGIAIFCLL